MKTLPTSADNLDGVPQVRVRGPYRPSLSDHSCKVATLPSEVLQALKDEVARMSKRLSNLTLDLGESS